MSVPQQMNHYRIVGPLAKGGMGEVALARGLGFSDVVLMNMKRGS